MKIRAVIDPPERLESVDAVRGLALGGMLLVNLGVFSAAALVPVARLGALDRVTALISLLLAEGKFYPLFAFLFGWGLAVQAKQRSQTYQMRRLMILGLIGVLHAVLLWSGDVLLSYALLGMIVRRWGDRLIQRKWLFVAMAAASLLLASALKLPPGGRAIHSVYSHWTAPLRQAIGRPEGFSAVSSASFSEASLDRLRTTLWKLIFFPDWMGNYLALILCGYLAGKRGWIEKNLSSPRSKYYQFVGGFLVVGLLFNAGYVTVHTGLLSLPFGWRPFFESSLIGIGGPLLAAAYFLVVLGIARLAQPPVWWRGLAGMGRMPLSLYLGQSLICGVICYPYGFGLYGKISASALYPLAAVIFIIQAGFSLVWLRHFKYGPMEAAWRRAVDIIQTARQKKQLGEGVYS